jgi:hypothetical protein
MLPATTFKAAPSIATLSQLALSTPSGLLLSCCATHTCHPISLASLTAACQKWTYSAMLVRFSPRLWFTCAPNYQTKPFSLSLPLRNSRARGTLLSAYQYHIKSHNPHTTSGSELFPLMLKFTKVENSTTCLTMSFIYLSGVCVSRMFGYFYRCMLYL